MTPSSAATTRPTPPLPSSSPNRYRVSGGRTATPSVSMGPNDGVDPSIVAAGKTVAASPASSAPSAAMCSGASEGESTSSKVASPPARAWRTAASHTAPASIHPRAAAATAMLLGSLLCAGFILGFRPSYATGAASRSGTDLRLAALSGSSSSSVSVSVHVDVDVDVDADADDLSVNVTPNGSGSDQRTRTWSTCVHCDWREPRRTMAMRR